MDDVFDFGEDLIKVTEYEVLGKLPDPFLKEDGTRVKTPAEWYAYRDSLKKRVVELEYGTMPPSPEVFYFEKVYDGSRDKVFRVTAGSLEKQVSFIMKLRLPKDGENGSYPVAVDGDGCFDYFRQNNFTEEFLSRGIAFCSFVRTELANDIMREGRRHGPLYGVYPDRTFGALGAWAWGYSRCVDALETLPYIDKSSIAFIGHSRGAKTAMLAGVLDERAAFVCPNDTDACGCACFRVHMKAIDEFGIESRSETLRDQVDNFGYWLGEGMAEYADREADLPFDCHTYKALVAPRVLVAADAASDIWGNPVGAYQTSKATEEVYKFLGCPENFLWYYRKGIHCHTVDDAAVVAGVIRHKKYGDPLPDVFFKTPFKRPEPIFNWKVPEGGKIK